MPGVAEKEAKAEAREGEEQLDGERAALDVESRVMKNE